MFIYANSNLFPVFLIITTESSLYNMAGPPTVLYTFPFVFAKMFLSQITPDTLLHPLHPACTISFNTRQLPLIAL